MRTLSLGGVCLCAFFFIELDWIGPDLLKRGQSSVMWAMRLALDWAMDLCTCTQSVPARNARD